MARLGRYFLPEVPFHVVQRGNNRAAVFHSVGDGLRYRAWLSNAAVEFGCAIHAYVLMTNHVHLLVTPKTADGLPDMMQSLGRRYVRYINDTYGRTGTLWEGRYRATPVESEAYFFACCRYVELNPVRAGMVPHPKAYRWSSYRANAHGAADGLVTHHPLYSELGITDEDRQTAYRAMFDLPLTESVVAAIRDATNGCWPLGNDRFKSEIAAALKRRVTPRPKGRPPRAPPERPGTKPLLAE